MDIGSSIKQIREQKDLLQKQVADYLELDKSAYSKLEKGLREVKVPELVKLASLFSMSTDQIINFEGNIPKEVTIEDKTAVEQLKLIAELEEEDKQTIFKLIDKMLTNKKFKTFFQENMGK
jgi:transcriptional regulator with XRE-family HTH domain